MISDEGRESSFEAARRMFRSGGGDFHFAARFLRHEKRDAVAAVFAFCKLAAEATKIAPGDSAAGCGGDRISMVKSRIEDVFADRLEFPKPEFRDQAQRALHAFALTVNRFQIPRQTMIDFVEALRMDREVTRYATWSSLRRYCELGGGGAAIAISCVLGLTHGDARVRLVQLAVGMKLTQILQNLKQDIARDRIYLPLEDLARFKFSERELLAGDVNENFLRLIEHEAKRARELISSGMVGLAAVGSDRARFSAAIAALTHLAILDTIRRHAYDVLRRPAAVTLGQKMRRLPAAWNVARHQSESSME